MWAALAQKDLTELSDLLNSFSSCYSFSQIQTYSGIWLFMTTCDHISVYLCSRTETHRGNLALGDAIVINSGL